MIKLAKKAVFYIFAFAYSVAIFSSRCDWVMHDIPYLNTIFVIVIVTVSIGMVISYLRRPSSPFSFPWILILASTTHFALYAGSLPVSPLPPLAFLVMIASGLTGKTHSWIIAYIIFILGETIRSATGLLVNGLPITMSVLFDEKLLDPFRYIYLLFAGLMPALMSASYRSEHPLCKAKDSAPAATSKPIAPPPASDIRKTKTFIVNLTDRSLDMNKEEIGDLLSSVVYFMSRNFRTFSALGFIFDPGQQAFILNSFNSRSLNIIKDVTIPLGKGIVGRIGTEKRSFMSGELSVYSLELFYYSCDEQINSILAVPIISDQSELLGALVLDSKDRNAFKDQDKDILKRFSHLAAALITNARMRFFQERAALTFRTFYQASHRFITALNVEKVFEVLFEVVPTVVSCTRQLGIVFDEERQRGVVISVSDDKGETPPGFSFPINTGLYSFALQKRKTVVIGDYRQYCDRYYRFIPGEPVDTSIRSLIILPILDNEQRCRGLFSVESNEPNIFSNNIEQVLTTLVENASVAFIRASLYQRMEKLATTDGLTGLNNHRHFQELLGKEIERARRYKHPLSLLIMDIDHFKKFNDTYGHPVGDLVLKEIAACIRKSIRCNDIPARYGGEEFVVIIPETAENGAYATAERIRTTVEQHTVVSLDRILKVTVSIGCGTFPQNALSQQALIDTADKALYAAKKAGRNRVMLYRKEMEE